MCALCKYTICRQYFACTSGQFDYPPGQCVGRGAAFDEGIDHPHLICIGIMLSAKTSPSAAKLHIFLRVAFREGEFVDDAFGSDLVAIVCKHHEGSLSLLDG